MENVAFFVHILRVLLVVGIAVAGAAFEAARRAERLSEIALLFGLTRVGVVLVAVGTALAGVFGLWLRSPWEVGYGTGWVDGSIMLFFVMIGPGGIGGRRPKQARLLARASPSGTSLRTASCARCSMTGSPAQRTTARCCSFW